MVDGRRACGDYYGERTYYLECWETYQNGAVKDGTFTGLLHQSVMSAKLNQTENRMKLRN